MRKSRVSDGVRTRDNRSHNPCGKERSPALSSRGSSVAIRDNPGSFEAIRTGSEFPACTPVIILAGLAKGKRGTVRGWAGFDFEPGIPLLEVEFPMPEGVRLIRADYLAVAS